MLSPFVNQIGSENGPRCVAERLMSEGVIKRPREQEPLYPLFCCMMFPVQLRLSSRMNVLLNIRRLSLESEK